MENVWTHGELSASEVGKILSAKRRLAQNTVWTLLLRMEEKGWLMPREEGRTHRYRAAVPRETSIGKKVVELVCPRRDSSGGAYSALPNLFIAEIRSHVNRRARVLRCLCLYCKATCVNSVRKKSGPIRIRGDFFGVFRFPF